MLPSLPFNSSVIPLNNVKFRRDTPRPRTVVPKNLFCTPSHFMYQLKKINCAYSVATGDGALRFGVIRSLQGKSK